MNATGLVRPKYKDIMNMCELKALCKKLYGMNCKKDKNGLKCLIVRGDNGKLIDFQLNKDFLKKIRRINRY